MLIGHRSKATRGYSGRQAQGDRNLLFKRALVENGGRKFGEFVKFFGGRGTTANILEHHVGVFRQRNDLLVVQLCHRTQTTITISQHAVPRIIALGTHDSWVQVVSGASATATAS